MNLLIFNRYRTLNTHPIKWLLETFRFFISLPNIKPYFQCNKRPSNIPTLDSSSLSLCIFKLWMLYPIELGNMDIKPKHCLVHETIGADVMRLETSRVILYFVDLVSFPKQTKYETPFMCIKCLVGTHSWLST